MATLTELQTELTAMKAARMKVLTAQSWEDPSGAKIQRPNLEALSSEIRRLELRIEIAGNNGQLSHANTIFRGSR